MWLSALGFLVTLIPIANLSTATGSDVIAFLVVAVGIAAYCRDARVREVVGKDPVFLASLAFSGAMALSMLVAAPYTIALSHRASSPLAANGALTMLFPLVLPATLAVFRLDPRWRSRFGRAAAVMVVLSTIASLIQFFGIHPIRVDYDKWNELWRIRTGGGDFYRATGFFRHAIHFGATMAVLAFWFFGKALYGEGRSQRVNLALGSMAIFTAIITFTKSVWVGSISGAVALAFMAPAGWKRRAILGTLAGVLIVAAALPLTRNRLPLFSPTAQASRLELWGAAFQMFKDSPVTGQGHNSYRARASKYFPLETVGNQWEAMDPHNMYMEVLSGSGLVGILAMLSWLGLIGWRLAAGRANATAEALRWRSAALGGWAFVLVAGTFDHYLTQRQMTPTLLSLWAAGLATLAPAMAKSSAVPASSTTLSSVTDVG